MLVVNCWLIAIYVKKKMYQLSSIIDVFFNLLRVRSRSLELFQKKYIHIYILIKIITFRSG